MRTGNHAPVDGALHVDIGIAGAFGAEIAKRGEAGHERIVGVLHGFHGAESQRLFHYLVVPGRLVIRVQEQMPVPLDHAGHQRVARQIDHLHAGGDRQVRANRGDLVALLAPGR